MALAVDDPELVRQAGVRALAQARVESLDRVNEPSAIPLAAVMYSRADSVVPDFAKVSSWLKSQSFS